jgi:hypothetical protein
MNVLFSIAITLALYLQAVASSNVFTIESDPRAMQTPLQELRISRIPSLAIETLIDRRQPMSYGSPGDYYRSPGVLDTVALSIDEIEQIKNLLSQNIRTDYYDSLVIANITGYQYQYKRQNEERREYYVRYARNDTVFVISGWLGKLFSFYISLPGRPTFDEGQLQAKVSALAYEELNLGQIPVKRILTDPYFIEYIDKANMVRVRSYHVREFPKIATEVMPSSVDRSLIEITKFLDKEAMP